MRGTPRRQRRPVVEFGIIPAYAGNTLIIRCISMLSRDHPRVCGEHADCNCSAASLAGSSPRMRGTPHVQLDIKLCRGIIPAYAGNTGAAVNGLKQLGDHPRVCGEHFVVYFSAQWVTGSSPRMRGTHSSAYRFPPDLGIIPAYAGNTANSWLTADMFGDHPRVCGEHTKRL